MAICGCGLPACCCQPAVAGGVIYADLYACAKLWGELSTHLAPQSLFTQISVHDANSTSFPLSKHTGGSDTAPAFSGLCVYLQLTWEVGLPPCPVEFSSLHHSHKLSSSWFLGTLTLSGQAWLVYLQFWVGFPSPPLWRSGCPTLFATCLYCSYCLLLSFSFFSGWGSVCPGGYADLAQDCMWEYHVLLTHLVVHIFPSRLGLGDWQQPRGPPGFSVQREVKMLCAGCRCGGVKVLPLLSGLACKMCLQCLSKISL
jgi:hypothetical protein